MKEQFEDFRLDEQQTALFFGGSTHGTSAEDFPEDVNPPPPVV